MVSVRDVAAFIEKGAPLKLAEEWDNVGLLVGGLEREVKRVLVSLDVSLDVAREAVSEKIDLILSHHPVIFKGLKRIVDEDPKGRMLGILIKNGISVYSAHTNLDVAEEGVNHQLAAILGLTDIKNLRETKAEKLFKLITYVPDTHGEKVREALCSAGAGWIGNYSDCTFISEGTGTFKPLEGTNPFIGSTGKLERVKEIRLETVIPEEKLGEAVNAMFKTHPYEEPAYDIISLQQKGTGYGLGKVGRLGKPVTPEEFTGLVKKNLNIERIKLIGTPPDTIKKVAVFCGSFDEGLISRIKQKADVLVTGDVKHHAAADLKDAGAFVVDAGHYGTERIILPVLAGRLKQEFKDVDVIISRQEKDPIIIA